jgi:thiol-disulfide isomerase/thioredoxin
MTRLANALLAIIFVAACAIAALFLTGVGRDLAAATFMDKSFAGTRAAPEFVSGLDWINTGGKPITLASLRGKVVLLDFWTYGCANCMHVIADLERLEQKYADSLVVIGVHSAKFANEGRTSQIRKVVQRYELKHPVVNDKAMQIWDAYGARAWPTLALVDPAGNAVGQVAGEGHYDTLDRVIGSLVAEFEAKGALKRSHFPITPDPLPKSTLLFPGKVLADAAGKRLFIADTLHHRIVVTDLAGKQLLTIGAGQKGFVDGAFASARFDAPQGMALADADTLYVADERNDSIRRVDLAKGLVSTVAGNGQHGYMRGGAYDARATTLNTPWDLLWRDGQLYIAMAGQHQLWRYDPKTQRLKLHAGSGYEQLEDGSLADAGLNQPSGLTTDGKQIYFADSEASAIRSADFATDGQMRTLIGVGLFDFGDVDGKGRAVRLQHPLGVSWLAAAEPPKGGGGQIYIADTYNGKLKKLDPATLAVTTLAAGLDEPGGLSAIAGKVYIADTNHHAIKVYDLATKQLSTLAIQ